MPAKGISFSKILNWTRLGVVVFALALCGITITLLYVEVWYKSRELSATSPDDSFWSLAQADVEVLALQSALHDAIEHKPADLRRVRSRYDIYYSRIQTLRNSSLFVDVLQGESVDEAYRQIAEFFHQTLPIIDGPNDVLEERLPTVLQLSEAARIHTREITLAGMRNFAVRGDEDRADLARTVSRLATLTVGQVAVLVLLILALIRMLRVSHRQAKEQTAIRDRLEVVVKTAIDAVLVVGDDGKIMDYNGAAERVFGYGRDEIIGNTIAETILPNRPEGEPQANFQWLLQSHDGNGGSIVGKGLRRTVLRHKTGRLFPADVTVDKVKSGEGEIYVSYVRDISNRLAAEHELVEARDHAVAGEKAKARLLAVMSHEMRTPLNGMIGTLELLDSSEFTQKQQRHLNNLRISSELLRQHVNDVLDISRLDAEDGDFPIVTFDGSQIVDEVLDIQRSMARIQGNKLTCNATPGDLADLRGDPRSLRQVLLNLVGNAVKFTRNGEVTVEIERLPRQGKVEIRVIDTGQGIADEDLPRIFEDFVTLDSSYQRQTEGTGLGLGITRRLVKAMGGEMGVESELGEGSLFWVRLKTAEAEAVDGTPDMAIKTPPVRPHPDPARSILLVEDNEINRVVARELLELEGCEVTEARNGREAIEKAQQLEFDLILMDISMPGLDGISATAEIRAGDGPNVKTPVVALTAHALPEEIEDFLKAGMSQVLIKPITRSAIATSIRGGLDQGNKPVAEPRSKIVDIAVLEQMSSDLGDLRARELTLAFIAETDSVLETLCDDAQGPLDALACAEIMHRLAGSAAMFGAVALRAFFLNLEQVLRQASDDLPLERAVEMKEIWSRTRRELEGYIHPQNEKMPRAAQF